MDDCQERRDCPLSQTDEWAERDELIKEQDRRDERRSGGPVWKDGQDVDRSERVRGVNPKGETGRPLDTWMHIEAGGATEESEWRC